MTDNKQYPPLPDAEEVEQYVYRASRRYIPKDVIESMHDLMRAYVDADRAMRAAQAAPAAWRHSRTYSVYEAAEQVPIADGDEWAEPLYLHPPEAPASQDAEDAARYRYLKKYKTWDSTDVFYWLRCAPADEVDSIIDAARGAQGESNG